MENTYSKLQAAILIGDASSHLFLNDIKINHASLASILQSKLELAIKNNDHLHAEIITLAISLLLTNDKEVFVK
ncbi:hypothetical protein P349_04767 [Enterobacter sp. DC4]|uniref:hypothetical protein n=1 Tax=Enterobacter sp. DC4 TaxID=1395580 RepID=UPI0003ECEE8C|nr:hypothetical protein [Enterobacter sp. DC4]EWG67302.1 hypothetical protein P349_04767 [Enterobacter sp. DC4]